MTDAMDRRRPLVWEGSSKKDFCEFPWEVQKDLGVALFVVQIGTTPPSAKPWAGLGPGVFELVDDHFGDAYRVVYTVRTRESVHVLHAFQRKSKSGVATPLQDVRLIGSRLKAVLARYRATTGDR
jgi:phage-related protein